MKNSFFKILFWGVLLAVGFLIGLAWKSGDTTVLSTKTQQLKTDSIATTQPVGKNISVRKDELKEAELETIRLFEAATHSVAFITTVNVRRDYWSRNLYEIPRGTGSAFVWDNKGHVVTNFHVIQGADRAQVTLSDRTTWDAVVTGVAPEKDLAVLKIDAPRSQLIPLPVGSSDNLRVGQSVYAIGNPFGLDQTLTTGVISALGREIKSVSGLPIREVIQTDAAINPGNSGGPLLNSSGKLIGVNTAIYSPSGTYAGIGFSIPVDVVKWVVPELIEYGKIKRPSLGVELATTQQTKRIGLKGALVLGVIAGSAAEHAGIQPTYRDSRGRIQLGDLIVSINDDKIDSANDLILALEKYKAGEEVTVVLQREGKERILKIRLDAAQ